MTVSKITVDLKARTFTIEVPDEKIESILDKVEALFDKAPLDSGSAPVHGSPGHAAEDAVEASAVVKSRDPAPQPRRRGKGPSKLKSWDTIDFGFTPEQRQAIREFYSAKNPTGQGESVAVLIVKAAEFLGKKDFDGNEVHSLFRIVDLPTPKNLTAVFGNMKRDSLARYEGNSVTVTSFTEDEVNFKLPKAVKS